MGFMEWAALIGWAIVIGQNGFSIAKWIKGKFQEAKEFRQ